MNVQQSPTEIIACRIYSKQLQTKISIILFRYVMCFIKKYLLLNDLAKNSFPTNIEMANYLFSYSRPLHLIPEPLLFHKNKKTASRFLSVVQALNNFSVFHLDGLPWSGGGDVHFSCCMRLEALSYLFSDCTKKTT